MQMVGKNHVAPNRYAKINLCSLRKFDEGSVYIIARQVRPTPIGATGYEIKRSAWKDNVEPSRCSREFCHGHCMARVSRHVNDFGFEVAEAWAARCARVSYISGALRRAKRLQLLNRFADVVDRHVVRHVRCTDARRYDKTNCSA